MTKANVLIAAYDEANYIGSTLHALDRETVDPLVIVNGEQGAAETAAEARRYLPDSRVIVRSEMGKLPALQHGLKVLGQQALEPILLIDADSVPEFPKHWAPTMVSAVEGDEPRVAAGITIFGDGPIISCTIRSARRISQAHASQRGRNFDAVYGANMAIQLRRKQLLDEVLALEHVWPGEDKYLAHLIANVGSFEQLTEPSSIVKQSSRFMPPLSRRFINGQEAARHNVEQNYAARKAPSVTHFFADGVLYSYGSEEPVLSFADASL